jgi:HK97 gp10 family phage protein
VATGFGLTWKVPLTTIGDNVRRKEEHFLASAATLSQGLKGEMVADMQQNAPWNDRTGNARAGLGGDVQVSRSEIVFTLFHSVYYGIYLEEGTRKMAPRPIIRPTMQAAGPKIMRLLAEAFGSG